METTWDLESVLLGRGGGSPGISRYDIDSGEIIPIWSLPRGQSVYALALSPDGNRLAAGTKAGFLYYACNSRLDQGNDEADIHKITHGFAILSACFVDADTIAVSDINGRCLLWRLDGTPSFAELPTGGSIVCSLFRLGADRLAGLTLDGKLLVWLWFAGEIQLERIVPKPPPLCALIKPVPWPAAGAWVWIGREGQIVIYSVDSGDIRTIRAHDGDAYAVAVCSDELLTVGKDDGVLKRWRRGETALAGTCAAPWGTIGLTAWANPKPTVMLVDERGAASMYDFSSEALAFSCGLRGRDFRVIWGPDQDRLTLSFSRRQMQQVQEIADRIRDSQADRGSARAEEWHQQLVALGYEYLSLALRAEAARYNDDAISELRYSKEAAVFVQETDRGAYDLLLRYASLLESVWQMPAAYDLCRRLAQQFPSDELRQRSARLEALVAAMEGGDYVIESSPELPILVESARTMGERFRGRYAIRCLKSWPTGIRGITPSLLISAYERLCLDRPDMPLPSAKAAVLRWLSGTRSEYVSMVFFDGPDTSPVPGLEFGLRFCDAGLQTVLVPVVLFNADAGPKHLPPNEHNEAVSRFVEQLNAEAACIGWLESVEMHAHLATNTLINEQKAWSTQSSGVDYGTSAM